MVFPWSAKKPLPRRKPKRKEKDPLDLRVTMTLHLPTRLKAQIDELAEVLKTNRSRLCQQFIEEGIKAEELKKKQNE